MQIYTHIISDNRAYMEILHTYVIYRAVLQHNIPGQLKPRMTKALALKHTYNSVRYIYALFQYCGMTEGCTHTDFVYMQYLILLLCFTGYNTL